MTKQGFSYSVARASPATFAALKSNAQSPTHDGYTPALGANLKIERRLHAECNGVNSGFERLRIMRYLILQEA